MNAIYKREMRSYFTSPIGYIFMAMFLVMSSLLFSYFTFLSKSSRTSDYFLTLLLVFIIVIPLLTMKLMSEERKLKTEQILLTAPVSLSGIVIAKFLAAFTMFALTFVISEILHFSVLAMFATELSFAEILGNVIGILLVGGAFIAIGLFISSLTESQIVAAISTIAAIIFMMLLSVLSEYIGSDFLRVVVKWFAVISRFSPFTAGIFDLSSVIYYISLAVIFLFLTIRVLEKRRWA